MAESLQQLLVTNFGLSPSGYTGSQGEVGYVGSSGTNGYTGSAGASGTGILISNIQVTDSSYTVLDDTAVDVAGGYIKITGSGFASGCSVLINQTAATSVTFISSTEVRAQVPATTAGTYIVYVVNTNGDVAIRVNGVTFSATPTWVTASSLAGLANNAISIQLSASSAATYALQAGSSLPSGVTLSNVGLISGTVSDISSETVYNFTVVATDAEFQDSPRSFALTISVGDTYFKYTTLLLSGDGSLSGNTAVKPFTADASTNNFAVAVNGDTRVDAFNPHQEGYYSAYFDGTGDYLNTPASSNLDVGNTSWTIECWIYLNNTSGQQHILGYNNTIASDFWDLRMDTNIPTFRRRISSAEVVVSGGTVLANTWYHVALVRNGSAVTLYVNGSSVATNVNLTMPTGMSDQILGIGINRYGQGYESYFNGYISNLRIVKGTAVYTANFTPSTTPLTAIANTQLLTCQSNRLIDTSTNAFAITKNGDTAVRAFQPFVLPSNLATYGSGYFDGNGDYLSLTTTAFQHTGDFTYECWVYWNGTVPSDWPMIFDTRPANSSQSSSIAVNIHLSTYRLNFYLDGTNYYWGATALPSNQWVHIALVRSGGVVKIYQNGVVGTDTRANSNTFSGAAALRIGANVGNMGWWPGYISDFRVTNNAVYTANFTPPTAQLTAITGTTLLTAQFNGVNNNNTFKDSSENSFAITRVGNTTQGTFSPYGANWSLYTNGTNSYAYLPYSATRSIGTGDFSIECWIYVVRQPADYTRIWSHQSNYGLAGSVGVELAFGTVDSLIQIIIDGNSTAYASATYVPSGTLPWKNNWCHIVGTRQSGTLRIFVNGVLQEATTGATTNINGTSNTSFGTNSQLGGDLTETYISNFRMCVGSVPTAYQTASTTAGTAVFTPSATALTTTSQGASGVQLLAFQNNRFIDSSANNFAITTVNNPSIQRFSPFSPDNSYNTTAIGGSAYFDGTGDYLDVAGANCLLTGDFTVEAWVYPTSWGSYQRVISGGTSTFYWSLGFSTTWGGGLKINWYDGADYFSSAPALIPLNTWYHLAVVRTGSTIYYYINGVRSGSGAYSTTPGNASGGITIGRRVAATEPWYGYITDARVVVGTNMYGTGATCTVPTTPLTAVANTKMLFSGTNAGIVDGTMQNVLETVSGAKTSAVQSKFGGSSIAFNGSSDYCFLPNTHAFLFNGGDFTIELWAYISDTTSRKYILGPGTDTTSHYRGFGIEIWGQQLSLWASSNGTGWNMLESDTAGNRGATLMAANTWHHIAVTRSGNTLRSFVNGVVEKTFTVSGNIYSDPAVPYNIGRVAYQGGGFYYNGYMDDFRVTKGLARYTANFTPPATAFLTQ